MSLCRNSKFRLKFNNFPNANHVFSTKAWQLPPSELKELTFCQRHIDDIYNPLWMIIDENQGPVNKKEALMLQAFIPAVLHQM